MMLNPAVRIPAAVICSTILVWQGVCSIGWVDSFFLPSPLQVIRALWIAVTKEGFVIDLGVTTLRVLLAVVMAALVGIPAGLFFGYNRRAYAGVEAIVHALRSVPASALFPLFLLVIGVSERAIVALAFYPSCLLILVSTVAGARLANQRRMQQAEMLELPAWRVITDILFYESLPQVLVGLRNAVSYSLVLVVAVEMFIGMSPYGVGRRIFEYQSAYRTPQTYAAIATAAGLGICLNAIVTVVEKRFLRWLPGVQPGAQRVQR